MCIVLIYKQLIAGLYAHVYRIFSVKQCNNSKQKQLNKCCITSLIRI